MVNICKFDYTVDSLFYQAFFGDFDSDPTSQRFGQNVKSMVTVAVVAVIGMRDCFRVGRGRIAVVCKKCLTGLAQTHTDVTAALTADVIDVAIRDCLWLLMGLDRSVASRGEQLIDYDATTDERGRLTKLRSWCAAGFPATCGR